MDFKAEIVKLLSPLVEIDQELIEIPPDSSLGDFAVPCFKFARQFKKSPNKIAEELVTQLKPSEKITEIKNEGPYINFFVNKFSLIQEILTKIAQEKLDYGKSDEGNGKNIVIDFSSPNIAKPFGIAHIWSTVIGNSLYHIYTTLGYKVYRINHLGDWGTQFGKLMVAFTKWGDKNRLENEGIDYLVEIYIEFGQKAKEDPNLNEEAREWFKKLEDNIPEAVDLWKNFRDLSLREFKKYYEKLNVEFDYYQGEAFYNDQLDSTIKKVQDSLPTEISEGALIVDLTSRQIKTPLLLRKSDGATTYHTRDLAAAIYRIKNYSPEKILYVVGAPQKLHFKQLFATLEMMGYDKSIFEHIPFGNMTYEGVMMSTRMGNFIPLNEVLEKAVDLAQKIIHDKNPDLKNKEEVAKQVGIGAIIFTHLASDRVKNIDFKWDKALSFEGDTGPYLQYTHARICSIERKANVKINEKVDFSQLTDPIEFELVKKLSQFHDQIKAAALAFKPHLIPNYLLETAQLFNKFYSKCRIIGESDTLRDSRLLLADCVRIVINNGLSLLGILAPEEM